MNITIFGSGYVGLVTGACLAETGNDVVCVDIDQEKIDFLNQGGMPIYEPGLETLVHRNRDAGRLQFSTDFSAAVSHGLFQIIAVGTPPGEDGSADLQHVQAVARSIGQEMSEYKIVIDKSTVPVGTADLVSAAISEALTGRGVDLEYDVVSNPEFLKEGAAVDDFMKPDRIVVGSNNPRTTELMKMMYEPFNRNHDRMIIMDVRSAELTKYAANALLATKISFMNEMANIAERVGADIESVRSGIGSDPRIGYHFIYPGCGFGGSCFPKDVRALARVAHDSDMTPTLLDAVQQVNEQQKTVLFDKINAAFDGNLKGKTIAIWGLAFKPNTNDMREASSRVLMEQLWDAGAQVRAYDPEANSEAAQIYGDRGDLVLCESALDALAGADALAIVTEWREFRSPDFDAIKSRLSSPLIVDGRNLYDPETLKSLGFTYYAIGRGDSVRAV